MSAVVKKIRWMIHRDLADVLRIEWASFAEPADEQELVKCLRQPHSIGMVAEDHEGRILGYMIYELYHSRINLLKIAVSPWERRQGVGRQMLETLSAKLQQQNRNRVQLTIRETHTEAQLFFRRQGYRCVSTLRNSLGDSSEDSYVMQLKCHESKPAKPRFAVD
jgi:ribosomal-protein-alanine N-acetyltransferase